MQIRAFRVGDEAALHKVFLSAIHHIACKDYTPDQIEAWTPASLDQSIWVARMRGIAPFVVQYEGSIVAYADFQPDGYIDHFFVSATVARIGVGTMLMNHIHTAARARGITTLTSDVSLTAQSFFANFGFAVVEQRVPMIRGVIVPNAFMRKQIYVMGQRKPLITIEPASEMHRASVQTMLHEYLLELGASAEYPYLERYWREDGRFPYLIRINSEIAGFALVRKKEGSVFEVAEFCVLAHFRHTGAGRAAATAIFSAHPGEWEVRGFPGNAAAAAFWRHTVTQCANDARQTVEDGVPVYRFFVPGGMPNQPAQGLRAAAQVLLPLSLMDCTTLRDAQADDQEFIFEAYKKSLKEHVDWAWGWNEEFQRAGFWTHHPLAQFRVIEVDGKRAGGIHVAESDAVNFVRLIFLLPQFRMRGLGSALLMQEAEHASKEHKALSLKVIKSNPAKSLYDRLGFIEVAQDEVSYEMRWTAGLNAK
jgi:putative acetyltransferase